MFGRFVVDIDGWLHLLQAFIELGSASTLVLIWTVIMGVALILQGMILSGVPCMV